MQLKTTRPDDSGDTRRTTSDCWAPMNLRSIPLVRLAVALTCASSMTTHALSAQRPDYPLAPLKPSGDLVAPFFDGFYTNPDGTFTLSFGYMNRNTEQVVEIPLGENNYIEPREFDGVQPTHFPPVFRGGFSGRRERGAFAITVPAEFADRDVVWTLSHAGQAYSIPGRVTSPAYELSLSPAGSGSLAPMMRFEEEGPISMGREGIYHDPVTVRAGLALPLTVWVQDRGERARVPLNVSWQKHQGPGSVEFDVVRQNVNVEGWGEAGTVVTFRRPGEYVVRVRADNFRAADSGFDYNCCWSNAFVPVTVTP